MALNTINTGAISFKKLSGKVHTQQNFAVTEEGISTNLQMSYSTVFANPILKLPVTDSGLTSLYSTDGIVERVKFQIDIIPDTEIAVGRSQGYRLKLPSDYNSFGELYPTFSAGTYLHTALGKLQIVPSLYGTLKSDGSTEYDPILYQTNGSTVIGKFDPINWYLDTYSGILFIQDPPNGYDSSAARPGYLEAFLYVGDYMSDIAGSTLNASNGLTKLGNNIVMGGTLTGDTTIDIQNREFKIGTSDNNGYFIAEYLNNDVVYKNNNILIDGFAATLQSVSGTSLTTFEVMPDGIRISLGGDNGVQNAMYYDQNYSNYFGKRSIVDKDYITGITSTLVATANNGLTKSGDNIHLGGALTGNTTIDGNGFNVNFGASTSDRMGNLRVWSNGTVGLDGNTSSFLQSSGSTVTTTPTAISLSSTNVNSISNGVSITANDSINIVNNGAGNFNLTNVNDLRFEPQTPTIYQEGKIFYDNPNKSISYYDDISGTSIQIGYETLVRARNNTGSQINNGQVVYISGAVGQTVTIALAQANDETITSKTIGIATHNIPNNTVGKVCVFGLVNDVNTNSFAEGDRLYLSATVAGGLVNTPPVSPNAVKRLGIVQYSHSTNGKILVNQGSSLDNNNNLGTSQEIGVTQNAVKTYIDNKVVTGLTANNGLTKLGNNVRLGGTLTGTTSITGSQILNLGTTGSRISQFNANTTSTISLNSSTSNVNIGATSGFVNITSSNVSSNGILIQSQNSLTLEGKTISIKGSPSSLAGVTILGASDTMFLSTGADLFVGGQPGFKGAQYDVDYSADFGPRSLVDKAYVTGLTSTLVTANNGLTKSGSIIRLGGSLTGSTTLTTTSVNNLLIAGFPIRYTTDLSSNFNTRSLVDKAYVTGITSTLVSTANNGLTKIGSNLVLGGTLTGNTSIVGSSNSLSLVPNSLLLQSIGANVTNGINLNSTNGGIIIQKNGGVGGEIRIQSNTGITLQVAGVGEMRVQHASGLASSFAGIKYVHNYSNNFGPRSLVDKGYVTGLTSGFTVVTASNGLTKVGDDIQLGGTLSGSTTIDVNLQQLAFNNLESLTFSSSGNTMLSLNSFGGNDIVQVDTYLTLSPFTTGSLGDASGHTRSIVYDTDTNQIKYSNGVEWSPLGSSPNIVGITANTTLISSRYTLALVDSTSSGLTVTFPLSPLNGDTFIVKDRTSNALTNNITINGNGKNIDGASTAIINTNNGSFKTIYSIEFDEWYIVGFIN